MKNKNRISFDDSANGEPFIHIDDNDMGSSENRTLAQKKAIDGENHTIFLDDFVIFSIPEEERERTDLDILYMRSQDSTGMGMSGQIAEEPGRWQDLPSHTKPDEGSQLRSILDEKQLNYGISLEDLDMHRGCVFISGVPRNSNDGVGIETPLKHSVLWGPVSVRTQILTALIQR